MGRGKDREKFASLANPSSTPACLLIVSRAFYFACVTRVIKNILTSVKAETTDAVLPNCVGCSLWNTCKRFFANLVLTCKVIELRDKYTMLSTVPNI